MSILDVKLTSMFKFLLKTNTSVETCFSFFVTYVGVCPSLKKTFCTLHIETTNSEGQRCFMLAGSHVDMFR